MMGLMVMTPKRRLRRSVFASLFKLIVCTSNVVTKLVLPPTLFPNSVGADTDYWPTTETGVSLEGTTARTIGVCLERFSHKKRFGRQLLSWDKMIAMILSRNIAGNIDTCLNSHLSFSYWRGPHFTTMCMYLHSCVQSDSNSHKHLQVC